MPINYSCDNCGLDLPDNLSRVYISGGKKIRVLCEDCWVKIEDRVLKEKEPINGWAGLKALDKLFNKKLSPIKTKLGEVEAKLDRNTASVMKIEKDINAALELRKDVTDVSEQVKNHEERISQLENH